jgi:hypothetical protein
MPKDASWNLSGREEPVKPKLPPRPPAANGRLQFQGCCGMDTQGVRSPPYTEDRGSYFRTHIESFENLPSFVIPAKAGIYEAIERTGFLLPQE